MLGLFAVSGIVTATTTNTFTSTELAIEDCDKCGKKDCKGDCEQKSEKKECSSKSKKSCCSKKKSCSSKTSETKEK